MRHQRAGGYPWLTGSACVAALGVIAFALYLNFSGGTPSAPQASTSAPASPSATAHPNAPASRKPQAPSSQPSAHRPTLTPTPRTTKPQAPSRTPSPATSTTRTVPTPAVTTNPATVALGRINMQRQANGAYPLAEYPGMSGYADQQARAHTLAQDPNYAAIVSSSDGYTWNNIVYQRAYRKVGIAQHDGYYVIVLGY